MRKEMLILSFLAAFTPCILWAQGDCCAAFANQAVQHKATTDSLGRIIKSMDSTANLLRLNIIKLQKDSAELVRLKPQIAKLDKHNKDIENLKNELDAIKKDNIGMVDSLRLLSKFRESNSRNTDSLSWLRQKSDSLLDLKKDMGLYAARISAQYKLPFDNLVSLSALQKLDNDSTILSILNVEKNEKQQILLSIQQIKVYKRAASLLNEKFEKTAVDNAVKALQPMTDRPPVKSLAGLLSHYDIINRNLINLIKAIQEDNKSKAGKKVIDLINEKKNATLALIDKFAFDNEVDLSKYSYLAKVVEKLKNRKLNDVDADVADLISEL